MSGPGCTMVLFYTIDLLSFWEGRSVLGKWIPTQRSNKMQFQNHTYYYISSSNFLSRSPLRSALCKLGSLIVFILQIPKQSNDSHMTQFHRPGGWDFSNKTFQNLHTYTSRFWDLHHKCTLACGIMLPIAVICSTVVMLYMSMQMQPTVSGLVIKLYLKRLQMKPQIESAETMYSMYPEEGFLMYVTAWWDDFCSLKEEKTGPS